MLFLVPPYCTPLIIPITIFVVSIVFNILGTQVSTTVIRTSSIHPSTPTQSWLIPNSPPSPLLFWPTDLATTSRRGWKKRRQQPLLCLQHHSTGALTLVANDAVWKQQPENLTNAAHVLAGTHAATYYTRPTWDMLNAHANNAASAVVSMYRQEVTRYTDYTLASKVLAKVLLNSIEDKNQVFLKTLHPTLKIYFPTPHQPPTSNRKGTRKAKDSKISPPAPAGALTVPSILLPTPTPRSTPATPSRLPLQHR